MARPDTILLVDDEPQIQRFLRPALVANGYAVEPALTGRDALARFQATAPVLVVLDLGLPDMDGLAVLAELRKTSTVPVVVLSARDDEDGKVAALDGGADDYVSKPFSVPEFMARLRTAIRHAVVAAGDTAIYRAGDLTVDTLARRVTRAGAVLKLTPREFELLQVLARHAGRVMTHRQILKTVWGPAHAEDAQYLRVFVGRLRQKIETDPTDPQLIVTEPGIGYRLTSPE